jgi:alpha-D-xyloside xylohydrolase
MKQGFLTVVLLLACSVFVHAGNWQKTELGVRLTNGETQTEIQCYDANIVRVIKKPVGKTLKKESLSVVLKPVSTRFSVSEAGNLLTIKTDQMQVSVEVSTGKIAFLTAKGAKLIGEKDACSFVPFNDAGEQTFTVSQRFQLAPASDESIFGLGQQQDGKLSRRNIRLNMVQGNTDDYVPFFASTKGYGLFWDNYSPTLFEDNADGTLFRSDVGECVDYYVMNGGTMDGTIAGMRTLTGQAPMFPLWTFGFWQSKERYKSQDELTGVVRKYRSLGVPLDGIIQDWQYWGNNYLWNAMDFLNSEFPNGQKMVDDVHAMNAHLIISIWASFGPQTLQYKEMAPKGMLLDFETWPQSGLEKWPPDMRYPSGVKPYDPYNPEARDIFWKYLNKGLFALGMDGWWMDSTEPDHHSFKPSDFDVKTWMGSFRKVRNAFPLMTVGGVASHQRAVSQAKRVFILTRSAFAGQQRYGANTWSGDVNSSWQNLRNQVPAGLNFSLTGMPYWNSDIGGFFAGSYNRRWNDGTGAKNPMFQELYVRWLQFGAFTPMMRSHGTEVPREIYNFGQKGEPVYDAIEKAIRLRYSLLPYMYSTAWSVTDKQSTIMRALAMDFGKDAKATELNDEYMFGKSILVAPVLHAQYTPETVVKTNPQSGWDQNAGTAGNKPLAVDFSKPGTDKVYLPSGTAWFDFWTNERQEGGAEISIQTTLDRIPLFIKAGTILPLGPDVQYAMEKNWDNLEIRVYPGADGSFTLYEDENDNYNYEKGVYATITFHWNDKSGTLSIGERKGSFPGMLTGRTFRVVKAGPGQGAVQAVRYLGKALSVKMR